MSNNIIIQTHNLGKMYKIVAGDREAADTLKNHWNPLLRRKKKREHWALRHINLSIEKGSIVAIMGKNGSGKSTLLRLFSEITAPTEGEIILRGTVSSMLEAGVGFHPELTGRENIYLNGTLIGIKRKTVDNIFDDLVRFAEIHDYMDTAIKKYSSGMFSRLAFAVASHLNRDILIVDEVLSVSDSEFREKAIDRLKLLAKNGTTILMVSHDVQLLQQLCDYAVYLDKGSLLDTGSYASLHERYFG